MSEYPAHNPSRTRASAYPAAPEKTPREAIWRLVAEADRCPEFLPRALGIVAGHGLIPLAIGFSQRAKSGVLKIEIDLAECDRRVAMLLLAKFNRMVGLRSITLVEGIAPPQGVAVKGPILRT